MRRRAVNELVDEIAGLAVVDEHFAVGASAGKVGSARRPGQRLRELSVVVMQYKAALSWRSVAAVLEPSKRTWTNDECVLMTLENLNGTPV